MHKWYILIGISGLLELLKVGNKVPKKIKRFTEEVKT